MPIKYDDFVKAPQKEVEWTPEKVKELIECKNDLIYFATHYIKVAHQEYGIMVMEPRDYQTDLWNKFINHNRNIVLMSRQSGKSASVSAYVLWFAIFNDNKNIGIVSNKEKAAKQFLMRLKDCYLRLPDWLKPGVTQWAETSVRFENGTYIQIAATSGDSFRGEPLALLICDEFAAVEPWKAQEFWASVYPTVSASKTAKVIIISTAKGMHNQFHKIWVSAVNKTNSFIYTKYDWRVVPGRTKEWAEEEKGNIGSVQFNQEFNCEFLGSTNTVIDNDILEEITGKPVVDPNILQLGGYFRIYERPKEGNMYIIGCDVAKGTGLDYSTLQVLKVVSLNPVKLKQVATYECNTINPYSFSEIVNRTSIYYNNAYIMVENNSEGAVIVSQLWWEFENDKLVCEGSKTSKLGVRATTKTKPKAVLLMKRFIEDGTLELVDRNTITQFTDFQDLGNNRFACKNMHDDLISALYWACYFFDMNILGEEYQMKNINTFDDVEDEFDGWGLLTDNSPDEEEDWSWLSRI